MNASKLLHIKKFIVLIVWIIVSVPNIKAQYNDTLTYNTLSYKLSTKNLNYKTKFPGISNLYYSDLWYLPICCDNINLRLLKFSLKNSQCINFSLSKNIKLTTVVIDTLHSSVMNKLPYNLTLPNIDFHYTPRPTTLQGLGILLMGVSRAVLFPTAPDYKVDTYNFETLP